MILAAASPLLTASPAPAPRPAPKPTPTPAFADVAYGAAPHQILDVHLPSHSTGPWGAVIWYGGIWAPDKHAPLERFLPANCAVIAVETRTMGDANIDKVSPPISYVLLDARRAVQFVRLHAAKWNIDPERIAVGGGSQGTLPALYVACSGEAANPKSSDPVERVSTKVKAVGAWASQPSIDPKRMREWVPGVEWGAPALGCSFAESLKRRDELLPVIEKWSPDALVNKDAPPIYFENDLGLSRPENVEEMPYKVHCPLWGLGFQKLARQRGATVYCKFPDHPTDSYKDLWDFLLKQLNPPTALRLSAVHATEDADGHKMPDIKNGTVEMRASHRYLNLPSTNSGPIHVGRLYVDGELRRVFEIRLANGNPDWWAPVDIGFWKGKPITVEIDRLTSDSKALSQVDQTDEPKVLANFHHERFRQRFHYSAPRGFELDVEGGVYYLGEYHLFYVGSPTCTTQGAGLWEHAVSRDLVHWKDLDTSFPMRGMHDMWSGTVVIDWNNTSGLGENGAPPMVLFYTKPDFAPPVVIRHNQPGPDFNKRGGMQYLMYSTDGGRTMNDYQGNPVVPIIAETIPKAGPNRDPKVFWHEPTKQWFMIVYVALPGAPRPDGKPDAQHNTFRFLSSPNLRDWKLTDFYVTDFSECPDFYELPVDGNPGDKKWVIADAGGSYMVGSFDGIRFRPETPKLRNCAGIYYAGQTLNDLPKEDGRRIKMMWMSAPAPDMPFSQCVSLPMVQSLYTTPKGIRLASWPAKELEQLRMSDPVTIGDRPLRDGEDLLDGVDKEGVDIELDMKLLNSKGFDLVVEGMPIHYEVSAKELSCKAEKPCTDVWRMTVEPENGHIQLRVLSDVTTLEIFAQKGKTLMAVSNLTTPWSKPRLGLRSAGGELKINSLNIYSMRSIWDKERQLASEPFSQQTN